MSTSFLLASCLPPTRYDSHHPPSVHVLLPAAHIGRLVGKAGAMIKRIQQHNRSAISIGADCMPHSTEKLATVQVCGGIDI